MTYDLGIDVGTSYTAAAVCRPGRTVEVAGLGPIADNIPTVLYLGDDGVLIVGDAANRRAAIDPAGAAREFKRRLGDPTPMILRTSPYSAEALMARVIDHVVQRVSDRERGLPRHLVVTHPANWGPYKLELFDQALRMIDVPSSRLAEPHSAATAYASQARVPAGALVAVYDLGGGTFDAAVLRKRDDDFEFLGESVGIEHLGGVDFDEAIFQYVRDQVGARWPSDPDDPSLPAPMLHLRRSCTEAKELLSSEREAHIPVLLPGVDATVTITRAAFESMIAPRIEDSIMAMRSALSSAGVGADDLGAMLLVGGSSRIPLVGALLRERFGGVVTADVDPLYAVARGAAITASNRADERTQEPAPVVQQVPAPAPAPPQAPAPPVVLIAPTPPEPVFSPPPTVVAPEAPTPVAVAAERAAGGPPASSAPPEMLLPKTGARSGRGKMVAGLAAAALLAGAGVFALMQRGKDPAENLSTQTSTTAANAAADSAATTATPIGAKPASAQGMLPIPGGPFTIGSDKPESNSSETVSKRVDVPAFHMDKFEVSNEDFERFVTSTQASPPLAWTGGRYPSERAKLPVQGANFDWASAYCTSLGKRLPTEIEWEVAARGSEGRLYPWGNDLAAVPLPPEGTYASGTVAGNQSPFGVFDLTGNVWEWVADSYDTRVKPTERVLRGGQNGFLRKNVTRLPVDPVASNAITIAGFRCAASAVDPALVPTFGAYTKPSPPAPPKPAPLLPGVLVKDEFRDSTTRWVESSNEKRRFGYHPNEFFHLETKVPGISATEGNEARAMAPVLPEAGKLVDVKAKIFVEPNLTDAGGTYDFGLAFAFDRTGKGLIFIVSPRTSEWKVCFLKPEGGYALLNNASGKRSIPEELELSVTQVGPTTWQFRIDGVVVTTQSAPGFIGTEAGMVLLGYAGNKMTHVHFDSFELVEHS